MSGIVLPVSLTSEQANIIMELIKSRVTCIESIERETGVISPETKHLRDDLRDLSNWIWDHFGNEIERGYLL